MNLRLKETLSRARCVLLDFDGPVCSVFAQLPAPSVAAQLREVALSQGLAVAKPLVEEGDPITILRLAGQLDAALAARLESSLRTAEVTAIQGARPTPYAGRVLRACRQTGRSIAIVSNNCEAAIHAYLEKHKLQPFVDAVAGRRESDPALLKPNPHLVLRAMRELKAEAGACVLVGDSPADIESARAAGIRSIGYANRHGKARELMAAGAGVVVASMHELAAAL